MTKQQRKAMELALDLASMHHSDEGYSSLRARVQYAIKKVLAEQSAQPEPVAWRWSESNGQRWFDWTTDWSHYDKAKSMGVPIEYAYTSPPQRKPLTGDERFKLRCQWNPEIHGLILDYLIQQTEAAHGIKENT